MNRAAGNDPMHLLGGLCIITSLSSIPTVELLLQDGSVFSFIDIVKLFPKLVIPVYALSRSITDFQLLHIIDKTWDYPSLLFSFDIKYLCATI
jgi:hypothetical protein